MAGNTGASSPAADTTPHDQDLRERFAQRYDTSKPPRNGFEKRWWPRIREWYVSQGQDPSKVNLGECEPTTTQPARKKTSSAATAIATSQSKSASTTLTPALQPVAITAEHLKFIVPITMVMHHCQFARELHHRVSLRHTDRMKCTLQAPTAPSGSTNATLLSELRRKIRKIYIQEFGGLHTGRRRAPRLIVDIVAHFGPQESEMLVTPLNWHYVLSKLNRVTPWYPELPFRPAVGSLVVKVCCLPDSRR